jgi:predicted nucleic acid-binding protein
MRWFTATDLLIIATAAAASRTLYTLDGRQAELARAADVAAEIP